jgi:ADP-heptose:LPS heptosyltransferase
MQIPSEWLAARRVLAVRLDNLGDVLVTTPAIRAIKESLPGAEVTLLASPVGAQVGRLNHTIDDVLVYEAPWMDPWARLPVDSEREQRFIAELRARRFDAAVIFTSFRQSSLPSAYLCYLAAIPLRHAASLDGPGSLLTTRHKHPERLMHEVERGLDLVGAIGMGTSDTRLLLEVPDQARTTLALHLPLVGARGRRITGNRLHQPSIGNPLVVLHPGCSMPARTYPWQQFAEAADLLVERLGATVVITGSEGERELVERIREHMRHSSIGLAGALPFALFCALVEVADLVVTNNTGPMHMAAALQTPVVSLFALTNPPEQWGPWHVPHRLLFHEVPCRICYSRLCPVGHECLRLVSPAMVVDAATALLSAEERGRGREFPAQPSLSTQRSALSTEVEQTDV